MIPLTVRDFTPDDPPRWCPGCGDFSVLAQVKAALAAGGVPRERVVFVSGGGCAGRLPHYLDTYGFQTAAGGAAAVATGVKLANPELQVWVVVGDGDGLAAGGGHLLHLLRRNVDVKVLLVNNEISGRSRGHASPTSRPGTRSNSSRDGSAETPLWPLAVALAAGATFAARAVDVDVANLFAVLRRAAAHRGTAFVEVYQNCNVFNNDVWAYATDRGMRSDHVLFLEQGRPMVFGRDRGRGVRLDGLRPRSVTVGRDCGLDALWVHDEGDSAAAATLARMAGPELPEPLGVLHAVRRPTFEEQLQGRTDEAVAAGGPGTLEELFAAGDVWAGG